MLPFPFHFLDNNKAMNVRPKHYAWSEFYDHLVDLTGYAFSSPAIHRRLRANRTAIPKWLNVVRAISSEGFGRLRHHMAVRRLLAGDRSVRRFFEGESDVLPQFYEEQIRRALGPLWDMLPPGALAHDQNVYLKAHGARMATASLEGATLCGDDPRAVAEQPASGHSECGASSRLAERDSRPTSLSASSGLSM